MNGSLDGVKVLDLSRILAGPLAAQTLSDLGADVLKIEAPWGDDTRRWGPPFTTGFDGTPVSSYFLSCNRGKRFEFINIKENTERVRKLIQEADVVIENFRAGTLERIFGELPDDVIICSITGFGSTGPRAKEGGYDLSLQARSGIMSITGEANGSPSKVGVAWIDVITGLTAVSSILAALFHKERTGEGQKIDISLWDCAISSLVYQAHNQIVTGDNPGRMGSAHPNLVPYRAFEASDGWFVIAVGNPRQWKKLIGLIGLEEKAEWATNEGRINNRVEIENAVSEIISKQSRQYWDELLTDVPSSPVNTVSEALSDPQAVSRGAIWDVNGVLTLASPFRFMSKTPAQPRVNPVRWDYNIEPKNLQ